MGVKHMSVSEIMEGARFLLQEIGQRPDVAIISGTGLEDLSEIIEESISLSVDTIPHFPSIGTSERLLISGRIHSLPVILLSKRLHVYEGFSMAQIASVIRLFKEIGVRILIITNAAGGLNPLYSPGQMMLITDHINLMGWSPLIGENMAKYGPRFPDMTSPYDIELNDLMEKQAAELGVHLWKGVYAGVLGPNLETRAETRFLRNIGADAVGMSTIPEVIAAVHCGIRTLGISVLSNINLPDSPKMHTLEGIVGVVKGASPVLKDLIMGFLSVIPEKEMD